MRRQFLVTGLCLAVLLAAVPAFAIPANDKAPAEESRAAGFVATVLERTGASLTLQKASGEVEILSFDEPGLGVRIDRGVAKGSRVKVTEESTSMSRTVIVRLVPAS